MWLVGAETHRLKRSERVRTQGDRGPSLLGRPVEPASRRHSLSWEPMAHGVGRQAECGRPKGRGTNGGKQICVGRARMGAP
jgi:hypothetical protein